MTDRRRAPFLTAGLTACQTPWRTAWALMMGLTWVLAGVPVLAHHSFAVFFDDDNAIRKVTGVVRDFRFTNPHGMVTLTVHEGKQDVVWRAETNSPSILRRKGWSAESVHPGETITVEGWPARDGSTYMRLRSATRANGELVGTAAFSPKE